MAKFGDVVAEFSARGLIHDSTDRQALTERTTSAQLSAYVGFDPTSDSLHAGNLLGQISLRRLQMLGHRPIVLAGGLGTRLKSVVADRPKCLAPVGQTVFLDIQLQALRAALTHSP